jgi:hypothetical protein
MVVKLMLVIAAVALTACQSDSPANNQAEAAPETNQAAAPETDVAAAQRLVRSRAAGGNGEITFGQPQSGSREGVSVVCGTYSQSGRQHRYIVVNRDDVFLEPEMAPGQMPQAVAEFCGDGERG